MFAKNTGTKVLGFGKLILVPGAADELPGDFNENHPVIKYYIGKGWLTPAPAAQQPQKEQALTDEEKAAKQKTDDLAKAIKSLGSMKLEELQDEAKELGIEFTEKDTKAVLQQKITEKYQTE